MIKQIRVIQSTQTVPYQNLALEEYLLHEVLEGECILYLWQNRQTVVVGRNQNCWTECRVEELEKEGGYLVRRLSGGGAVFHDLGNLNFTFLVRKEDYDVERQLDVILKAVQKFGIDPQKSGRNDMTVEGQKFSGNAFYSANGRCYHHGTLMLNADIEKLSRYLSVSAEKLQSKGVVSVKSRVANLTAFNPAITTPLMCEKLIEAFGEVYGLIPHEFFFNQINQEKLLELTQKFSSWEWKFGRSIQFNYEASKRFDWGDIQLRLKIKDGKVVEAVVYSDAMNQDFAVCISNVMVGAAFSTIALANRIDNIPAQEDVTRQMAADIKQLLLTQEI